MDDRVNQAETFYDKKETCPCLKASDPPQLFFRYMFVKPLEATQEMTDYLMTLRSELAANEALPSRLWMDWWKQSESMFASWSDAQHQLTESWIHAVGGNIPSNQESGSSASTNAIDAWREHTVKALHMQNQWLQLCSSMMGASPRASETRVE